MTPFILIHKNTITVIIEIGYIRTYQNSIFHFIFYYNIMFITRKYFNVIFFTNVAIYAPIFNSRTMNTFKNRIIFSFTITNNTMLCNIINIIII